MSVHEQFAEDLALYALGGLQGDERVALEKHVAECSACRRELEELRGDMALMRLSAGGRLPRRRVRQPLTVATPPERGGCRFRRGRPGWDPWPWWPPVAL